MSAALSLPFAPPAGRPLVDLPKDGCRYAIGCDSAGRHLFCGKPSVATKSWCPDHFLVVFSERGMGGMSLAQARESGRVTTTGGTR
ncbi:hypothetical protein [Methylobacterium sp. Gmos1]